MTEVKDINENSTTNHCVEIAPDNDEETPPSKNKCLSCLRGNLLTISTVIGVVLGAVLGATLQKAKDSWSTREIMYISFVGDLFLRMLKALILPLIISSLVSAISSLDLSLSKKVAARAIAYYITTTFAAVVLGIVLVVAIQPGVNHDGDSSMEDVEHRNVTTVDTLLDLVRNMFPPNLVQACTELSRTNLIVNNTETDIYKWKVGKEQFESGMNIIGLVVFAAVLGIAISQLGEKGKPLADLFTSLTDVSMKITTWVINLSPVGVFFLVCAQVLGMKDIVKVMSQLGLYFTTVIVGLALQGFVVIPLLYLVLTRKSPISYVMNLSQALATAFGTASSTATLPLTIKCLEEKNGVDPRVARFALPIGSTINMDGTALYEAVAAIFIAQARNIPLPIGKLIAISITATAASIGAAGIPQAGLVTMVMVLDTVGLPAEDVGLILAIDWLLDRCRTTINVMGDAFGAGIVNHRSQKELSELKS